MRLDLPWSVFCSWSVTGASLLGSGDVARLSSGDFGKAWPASGCTAIGGSFVFWMWLRCACRLCLPPLPYSSCFPAFQYRFLGSRCPGQAVSCVPSHQACRWWSLVAWPCCNSTRDCKWRGWWKVFFWVWNLRFRDFFGYENLAKVFFWGNCHATLSGWLVQRREVGNRHRPRSLSLRAWPLLRGETLNYKIAQNGCYGWLLNVISSAPLVSRGWFLVMFLLLEVAITFDSHDHIW